MAIEKAYTKETFISLSDVEHIRHRKSMYIGSGGLPGVFKLDCELVQNVLDEYNNGFGTQCFATYDSNSKIMHVEDWGRGIPVEMVKKIFTQKQTSGKYNEEIYDKHAGSNGVGSCVVSACSLWLKCEVWREPFVYDGHEYPASHCIVETRQGVCTREDIEYLENGLPEGKHQGTTVEYIVDPDILDTQDHDIHKFTNWLNLLSWLNNGFKTILIVDGKKTVIENIGGPEAHIKCMIKDKGFRPIINLIRVSGSQPTFDFDITFTYGVNNSGDSAIISHVNGFLTPENGTHVRAFKTGCALALTQYINETDIIPKSLKGITVSGAMINDNIIANVGIPRHLNPFYDTQTKDALKSTDVEQPITNTTRTEFYKWLVNNPKEAKKLVLLALDYAKYEAERRKLKKTLIDSKQTKSIFDSNSIDPSKYHTCRSNNPKEKELFICEGSSAAGNISKGRDSNFQALYALRGKIFNVAKTGISSHVSKEILDLAQISGLGIPINGKPKYENLAYDKFIILTDADDDGAHIRTLLMTFFWTFYPDLVKEGHVYIANPPLKKISLSNGSHFFLNTESDYDRLMKEFIINSFELYSEKTKKKLSEGLFRVFIDALNNYNVFMDNHAKALVIDPSLLENICINISIVSQCTDNLNGQYNKEFYKKTGYYIKYFRDTGIVTFDKGLYHANIKFDEMFISQHFEPICEILNDVMIYGVYLKGIRSNHEYHGTLYNLSNIMSGILGKSVIIRRSKGLGESTWEDLSETTLNPATRILNKVTVEDAIKAQKSIDIFMTDAFIQAKRLFYAGKMDF